MVNIRLKLQHMKSVFFVVLCNGYAIISLVFDLVVFHQLYRRHHVFSNSS